MKGTTKLNDAWNCISNAMELIKADEENGEHKEILDALEEIRLKIDDIIDMRC